VHLRSVLPPGLIWHAAEFPGEYRNGRAVQPQGGEMGRGEAQKNALLAKRNRGVVAAVYLAGGILYDLHLSQLLQYWHEFAQHEEVAVLRFAKVLQDGLGVHGRINQDLHASVSTCSAVTKGVRNACNWAAATEVSDSC